MTKEAFSEMAKETLVSETNDRTEVANSLATAKNMTSVTVLAKMQPEELQQHLINLGWEIYQFNTGIK
jgi:hypothetical protein